ncbi:MAG TPA: hypothetical protein VHF69_00520 [Candidatus Synoicihabitans sp.]|nr:hypothetical protein [Candidatus Synoicihabitans sp.]
MSQMPQYLIVLAAIHGPIVGKLDDADGERSVGGAETLDRPRLEIEREMAAAGIARLLLEFLDAESWRQRLLRTSLLVARGAASHEKTDDSESRDAMSMHAPSLSDGD